MFARHVPYEQLVAYVEQSTTPDATTTIDQHLASCAYCTREVAQITRLLTMLETSLETPPATAVRGVIDLVRPAPAAPSWGERLVALLKVDSSQGGLVYGLRAGQAVGRQLLYSAGDYEIDLRLRPDFNQVMLDGQVLGAVEAGQVQLQSDQHSTSAPINALGEFSLRAIPHGTYTLTLRFDASEIQVEELDL